MLIAHFLHGRGKVRGEDVRTKGCIDLCDEILITLSFREASDERIRKSFLRATGEERKRIDRLRLLDIQMAISCGQHLFLDLGHHARCRGLVLHNHLLQSVDIQIHPSRKYSEERDDRHGDNNHHADHDPDHLFECLGVGDNIGRNLFDDRNEGGCRH